MNHKLIETINEMLTEAYKKNWKVIAILPYNHPDDAFMVRCTVITHNNEAVSYIFNRGFQLGHYFTCELRAIEDMNNR